MRTLTLPLKGEYFDAIKAGVKPEEFRAATPYWRRRLEGQSFDQIELTRGYPKRGDDARRLVLPWKGYRLTTIVHPHFGADPVEVFAIDVSRKGSGSVNPIKQHFRLKKPCANCPFLKEGAIPLSRGRLEGIISTLIEDDHSTFQCHKTVHSSRGGNWDDDGNYDPSGHESMCAGAAAYLMKKGRPTVGMRFAFATGDASPNDWDSAREVVID